MCLSASLSETESSEFIQFFYFCQMSLQGRKRRSLPSAKEDAVPRLPPIPKQIIGSSRFDNSPLLKYRRSDDMQGLLANIV